MSSLKEKLDSFMENAFSYKGLLVWNALGFGLLGYYVYKKTQDDRVIKLEERQRRRLLSDEQYQQTGDSIKSKIIKRRKNARRISVIIRQDQENFATKLKIPDDYNIDSKLIDELRYMDSPEYQIQRIPHLAFDLEISSYQIIHNPLINSQNAQFTNKEAFVVSGSNFNNDEEFKVLKKYLRAGIKEEIFYKPSEVKALIVTCGGLCPGLNSVIREIVMTLHYNYGVNQVYASSYGYQGIYDPQTWRSLNPLDVITIHKQGGTVIGTSRGGFDLEKILNALIKNKVNQLYVIGGDGTHAGVYELYREIKTRKLKISVCGIPKTIDNDIPIIDSSFGYATCMEEAQRAINAAWVESHSHEFGVGLVKLMGRQAGWIAMGASYAARNVNICLIPESKFDLFGPKGLLEYIYQRLSRGKKCVIVVAEGAIEGCRDISLQYKGTDKSGNPILPDIANAIKKEIVKYCAEKNIPVTLKYIDPSYMIRTVPPNAQDQGVCSNVAQNAVHACMFGFSGFSNGMVNGKNCLISLEDLLAKDQVKNVPLDHRVWRRFLSSSGQPAFLNDDVEIDDEENEQA